MTKADIAELKKRMKKDKCAFTRIAGCCVGIEKQILTTFNNQFLTQEDGEQHKMLEIASKILSGKEGNNSIELSFPYEAEMEGGAQTMLTGLVDTELKDEEKLQTFYEKVIASYEHAGNYAILLFHDNYDVPLKGTDKLNQDESEEVHSYIICAICPIELSKAGLSYFEDDKKIAERVRDWVVDAPEIGFNFPAFSDRSTDIHSTLYYTTNPKTALHEEVVADVLGCSMPQLTYEKAETFSDILEKALEEEPNPAKTIYEIHDSLRMMIETEEDVKDLETGEVTGTRTRIEDVEVNDSVIKEALQENDVPEALIEEIQEAVKEQLTGETSVNQIVDRKLLVAEKFTRREEELLLEIAMLKKEIEELKRALNM